MSGDHGPEVIVPAAMYALNEDPDLRIILVGDEGLLMQHIKQLPERLQVQHASEVVEMDDAPALALKKKKDSSMRVSINLVKDGQADAAVSSGNTGALMATAKFVLKMLPGIERPAICTELPTEHGSVHMLDLGANVDCTPEMLLQFAYMGSELSKVARKIEQPRIGLLNVGSEEIKGNVKVKATAELLTASNLNYVGYVEGDEIFTDKADVIVCDGFEGNIALKTSEGVAHLIATIAKEEFSSNPLRKLIGLLCLPILKSVRKRLDPRIYNGATLSGLRGIVIKSHGSADVTAFVSAIKVATEEAKLQLPERILQSVQQQMPLSVAAGSEQS